jgi:stage V sporulation protein AE
MNKKVILVTDGDMCARKAVEAAAQNIGGRCISRSGGNPTPITGKEIIELVKTAKYDPVVVMVDDRGNTNEGAGEQAMEYMLGSSDIDVMGVVAVASNTHQVRGIKVDASVDREGKLISMAVDKDGKPKQGKIVKGDTVDILNSRRAPYIIGVGDPGKMDGFDNVEIGAPIITKALEEIIKHYESINGK